jgi:hypothetical protein
MRELENVPVSKRGKHTRLKDVPENLPEVCIDVGLL